MVKQNKEPFRLSQRVIGEYDCLARANETLPQDLLLGISCIYSLNRTVDHFIKGNFRNKLRPTSIPYLLKSIKNSIGKVRRSDYSASLGDFISAQELSLNKNKINYRAKVDFLGRMIAYLQAPPL
jgi:hypothetical protein